MKHDYQIEGFNYKLSPVDINDAQTIIDIRLEDEERNKYVHRIANDVDLEKKWLTSYFERSGDYLFKIVNKITKQVEGLISIYNQNDSVAELGRWTIIKGSIAAIESVYLVYKMAFTDMGLTELYCRTIQDNVSVVSFHESCGLKLRKIIENAVELNDSTYSLVEQFITKEMYFNSIEQVLSEKSYSLFLRNLRIYTGGLEFHHLGIACKNIEKDKRNYQFIGYKFENDFFEDDNQGIRGLFGFSKKQPCIELLENLDKSTTLTPYLENGIKIYHYGYYVKDIEKTIEYFLKIHAKIISPLKQSVYFKSRICFIMLNNMFLIELIEKV